MTTGETIETTSDERVMAALAHFFGLIAALLVWATQKDKSPFLRFQSLQALAFDAVLLVVSMLVSMCTVGIVFIGIISVGLSTAQAPSSPDSFAPMWMASMVFPLAMFACIMPFTLTALLIQTIAAVSVATGHNFRYPIIADRVDAFLRGAPASQTIT